jgi:hypothetical protein
MANGLQVVTARIPVVRDSAIGAYMHYYEQAQPQEIAQTIIGVPAEKTDGRRVLEQLDRQFCEDIDRFWNG